MTAHIKHLNLTLAVALILGLCGSALAEDKPRDRNLVLAGMAMGIPTYMLGVSVHEGSHALAGKLLGAKISEFSLIPGWHPRTDKFYFGYVTVRGLRSDRQRAWFLLAPKLSDSLLLGGYAALYATNTMPSNAYGQTAVLVLATGFWVDFSRDIVAWWDHNDTVKVYNMWGLDTELKRLPARVVHLGVSALMGYVIYRGYRDLFADEVGSLSNAAFVEPVLLPLFDRNF